MVTLEKYLMKQKQTAAFLCALMLVLMALPIFLNSNPSEVIEQREPIPKEHIDATLGQSAELRINAIEDEKVVSGQPNDNFHYNLFSGGLWVGYEFSSGWARSWLKYDLNSLQNNVGIESAYLNFYCTGDWSPSTDEPIGVYYSSADLWSGLSITWNNQPSFDSVALGVIDQPPGSELFVEGSWYKIDITSVVESTYHDDGVLSLVMKQVDETGSGSTWTYFADKEFFLPNSTHITVSYTTPDATNLAVDGHSSSPQIDYIQNDEPVLSWDFDSTSAVGQMDYEVEVWNNEFFDDTKLFGETHGDIVTIYDSGISEVSRPFDLANEFRYQMKYESTLFNGGGLIDKLYFEVDVNNGEVILEDVQVNLVCHDDDMDLSTDFNLNYGDNRIFTVLDRTEYHAMIQDGWLTIDVEDSFVFNGISSLLIELRFTNNTGNLVKSLYSYGDTEDASVAYTYGTDAYYSSTANWRYNRTHNIKIEYSSEPVMEFDGTSSNNFPFAADSGHEGRYMQMYNRSLIERTGTIDKLYFPTSSNSSTTFVDFKVYIAETPHEGDLNDTHFDVNYGGVTPILALDSSEYTLQNLDGVVVIELETPFTYSGTNNLLFDLQWQDKNDSGFSAVRTIAAGGYRAYNITFSSTLFVGESNLGLNLHLGFVDSTSELAYNGTSLTNSTEYFWRVRVCDGTGVWSEWSEQSFTYAVLTTGPEWLGLDVGPNPVYLGNGVQFEINVTFILGVNSVSLEIDGQNHSLSPTGDMYSVLWIPDTLGSYSYRIYMESNIDTWTTYYSSSDIEVISSTPTWDHLEFTPSPGVAGQDVTISINVTDAAGVDTVLIEIDGTNHTMSATGDTYSYTWTPADTGSYSYTIYMQSISGPWNITSGVFEVTEVPTDTTPSTTSSTTTNPTESSLLDDNLLLIIGGAVAAVVIIGLIACMRKK